MKAVYLGSHSTRNFSIKLLAVGCIVSPSMSSISLRYIHYEKAGDEFIERTVTVISSLSKEFAIYPFYFELENSPLGKGYDIDSTIGLIPYTQEYGDAQGPLYLLVRFLFSSILFHYDDLNKILSPSNSLRHSNVFIKSSNNMRKYAKVECPLNKTNNTPEFTGIPTHVIIMNDTEELKSVPIK